LESRVETYDYSQFKIEQIFKEIEEFISIDELSDMYWKRMVAVVEGKDYSGNRIGNCIDGFNRYKCRLRSEWMRWLSTKDEHSDIKNQILKEFPSTAFL
jgi:hypothetical protein